MQSIELYPTRPEWQEAYPTVSRQRLFASDGQVWILLYWALPGPGAYTSTVRLHTPAGAVLGVDILRFPTNTPNIATRQRVELPQGEAAQALAGGWEVEVSLDAKPVGRRAFSFDAGNIRLRTEARLLIVQGKHDIEALSAASAGDWSWRDQAGAAERATVSLALLGAALRDELRRRFQHVDGPLPSAEGTDATLLLTPRLLLSPNPDVPPSLKLEALHVPTKSARKFHVETVAGDERCGTGGGLRFSVAAAALTFRATASQEILEFLTSAAQAVCE